MATPKLRAIAALATLALAAADYSSMIGRSAAADRDPIADRPEELCGPRCVAFVLERLGRTCELREIISDMGATGGHAPVSMSTIQAALAKRGVGVVPGRLQPAERIVSRYPVIVHIAPDRLRIQNATGHFVVWLPESTAEVIRVWDGLSGVLNLHPDDFYSTISPIVLLTAVTGPIDTRSAVSFDPLAALPSLGSVIACVLAIALLRVSIPFPRRSRHDA